MPGAIAGIVSAIGTAVGAIGGFVAGFGVLNALKLGFTLFSLLGGKKKPQGLGAIDRSQMIRQTDAPREYVYGRVRKSGVLGYHWTSTDNQYFYMAIIMAAHASEEIEDIYIGDSDDDSTKIDVDVDLEVDTDFTTTGITHYKPVAGNRYADSLWIDISLGSASNNANARFIAETEGNFTSADKFNGLTTVFVKMKWNQDLYRGVPNVQVVMKGKNDVLDDRDSNNKYTDNVALCLADYLRDTSIGLNVATVEIDVTALQAAANVCEEAVSLDAGGTEERYTCNGIIDSAAKVGTILEGFTQAMAGTLVYVNGKFTIIAGKYVAPTITITEDDILTDISVARPGKRDKFNAVKGIFLNAEQNWKPTDFPHVTNSTYQTEDGHRIYQDVQLPFTTSSPTAQRIAKVSLERNRQDISVEMVISLRQWNIAAGDVVQITYSPFGWTTKVFDVIERNLTMLDTASGDKVFAIKLILRETASTVYDWSTEETAIDPAPNTSLPDPLTVAAPSNLSLDSTEDQLVRGRNGRIVSRIKLTWDAYSNVFVTEGGTLEIQYKKSSESTWLAGPTVTGDSTEAFVTDVDDRVNYDVRVRAVNALRSTSAWTTESSHTVIGKTTPPPNITNFTVGENSGTIGFRWTQLSILDVYGYEIRYGVTGTQWKDANLLTTAKQGTSETTSDVPPGTWIFLIKAVDYVGLYSNAAAAFGPVTIANGNSIVFLVDETGFTSGTLDNFVRHYTGVLVPDDQNLASVYDSFNTFNTFVPTPESICTYTSTEQDLTIDKDVRVWGNIVSELGPGETSGIANPAFQITWRASTDSSSLSGDSSIDLLNPVGTLTNCIQHYTGVIVPDSQSLANATSSYEVFDNFVYDAYENCTYEGPEQDLGADTNLVLDIEAGVNAGPGQTGTSESTIFIDTKTSVGTYGGFQTFAAGSFNLQYYKTKIEWSNATTVSKIASYVSNQSAWRNWSIGTLNDVRYVNARIRLDTSVGVAKVTDFDWTIDETP